jgi:hypothetical protein
MSGVLDHHQTWQCSIEPIRPFYGISDGVTIPSPNNLRESLVEQAKVLLLESIGVGETEDVHTVAITLISYKLQTSRGSRVRSALQCNDDQILRSLYPRGRVLIRHIGPAGDKSTPVKPNENRKAFLRRF